MTCINMLSSPVTLLGAVGTPGGALSQSQVMHMGSFLTVLTAMLGERQIYASPVTKISFLGLQSQGSGIVQPPALNLGGV